MKIDSLYILVILDDEENHIVMFAWSDFDDDRIKEECVKRGMNNPNIILAMPLSDCEMEKIKDYVDEYVIYSRGNQK